jgi:hypothetical protein
MATLTAHGTHGLVELCLEVDPEQSRPGWLVLRGRGCWIAGPWPPAKWKPNSLLNPWEHAMRKTAIAVGLALGLFFILRAIAEPFVIDMSDPSTYRNDWGGPSLLGVLLVHCGPGVLAAVGIAMVLIRRRSSGRAQPNQHAQP